MRLNKNVFNSFLKVSIQIVFLSLSGSLFQIVGRISTQFLHNRAFCEESTILTECVDFCRSMNIRYGAICEIDAESQKIRISHILI